MMGEPLRGWRHGRVTARRTRRDYAAGVREVVAVHYPQATKIRLLQDNLNTHDGAPVCTRRSVAPRPGSCWTGSSSTTRPRMAVG
jgi:hypothetical protein